MWSDLTLCHRCVHFPHFGGRGAGASECLRPGCCLLVTAPPRRRTALPLSLSKHCLRTSVVCDSVPGAKMAKIWVSVAPAVLFEWDFASPEEMEWREPIAEIPPE